MGQLSISLPCSATAAPRCTKDRASHHPVNTRSLGPSSSLLRSGLDSLSRFLKNLSIRPFRLAHALQSSLSSSMTDPEKIILQELVDALQASTLLATQLRQAISELTDDAIQLQAVTNRAVGWAKRLQPKDQF